MSEKLFGEGGLITDIVNGLQKQIDELNERIDYLNNILMSMKQTVKPQVTISFEDKVVDDSKEE
ncbi:MAG: hypothetical protein ACOC80_13060 [Petrotogales bacterium]